MDQILLRQHGHYQQTNLAPAQLLLAQSTHKVAAWHPSLLDEDCWVAVGTDKMVCCESRVPAAMCKSMKTRSSYGTSREVLDLEPGGRVPWWLGPILPGWPEAAASLSATS